MPYRSAAEALDADVVLAPMPSLPISGGPDHRRVRYLERDPGRDAVRGSLRGMTWRSGETTRLGGHHADQDRRQEHAALHSAATAPRGRHECRNRRRYGHGHAARSRIRSFDVNFVGYASYAEDAGTQRDRVRTSHSDLVARSTDR
ncbi:hypothetical protein ACWGPD_09855 [Streptomyces hirsutus]|uniref:hypothetical protein n=1 Tax=Streptomyces hirsutus TaxID=35620 RepID=UPI003630F0C0